MDERSSEKDVNYIREQLLKMIKPKDLHEYSEDGKIVFTFTWLLKEPMRLIFNVREKHLIVQDILTDISPESAIYADLMLLTEKFETGREDLLELELLNEKGAVSVVCKPKHSNYPYGAEKIISLVNDIFQKTFEDYPEYTKEKFGQVMVKARVGGSDHTIPVVLTPYRKGFEKTHPYRSPGSWDLATLSDSNGEYYYEQGIFLFPKVAGIDNLKLPILGFKDWHSGDYKIVYPIYRDLNREGSITYHTLANLEILNLSQAFDSLQKAISIIKENLLKIDLSHHEERRIESALKELPSHPVDLFFKYFALKDSSDFILRLLDEENARSLKGISKKLATTIDEENKMKLKETAEMLLEIRDKRDSAASFDESLRYTLAFREAVRRVMGRDRTARVLDSNMRNISRSGGGKSVYLGKEELKWIQLGDKALVKIVEYEPFRCRIEIYPI